MGILKIEAQSFDDAEARLSSLCLGRVDGLLKTEIRLKRPGANRVLHPDGWIRHALRLLRRNW